MQHFETIKTYCTFLVSLVTIFVILAISRIINTSALMSFWPPSFCDIFSKQYLPWSRWRRATRFYLCVTCLFNPGLQWQLNSSWFAYFWGVLPFLFLISRSWGFKCLCGPMSFVSGSGEQRWGMSRNGLGYPWRLLLCIFLFHPHCYYSYNCVTPCHLLDLSCIFLSAS